MQGIHILSNLYGCQFQFKDEFELINFAADACSDVGLTVLNTSHFQFQPEGLTFVILLAESHLSIHTWPELKTVVFDIYTCNYTQNNNEKALTVYNKIKDKLKPINVDDKIIYREDLKKF